MKKNSILLLMFLFCICLTSVAYAAEGVSNSKPAGEYGTLTGEISPMLVTTTRITVNPDNAYLRDKLDIQNSSGVTTNSYMRTSQDGALALISNPPPELWGYRAYCAHNVQGGSRYQAQVVYTTMRLN